MKRLFAVVLAIGFWPAPAANAQEFCSQFRAILAAAPTEFASLRGEALNVDLPSMTLFAGLQPLSKDSSCNVAQQQIAGKRYSTSYTCAPAAPDTRDGMQSLLAKLQTCLGVSLWMVEKTAVDEGPRSAQYGLLRISITHNGEQGLALGVEAFRDEHGDVMGSPIRGNQVDTDPNHACVAKSPEEIAGYLAMYGSRPGAVRFENDQFVGYTNRTSAPTVAFVTRPNHPAHPAIITRNVIERDGSTSVSVSGDFAGDCKAFHDLLEEVAQMNRNLGRQ